MEPIVNHIEIDRPPAAVFRYLTDPERFEVVEPAHEQVPRHLERNEVGR